MTSVRRRILLCTLLLLSVLDGARSLSARLAARQPTRLWSPDPSYARAIAWPPGSDLAAAAPRGLRIYMQHCAVCHGPDGRGNGPAAPSLRPRPRDFSGGVFKHKSTPEGQPPALDDIRETIRNGLPGSAMPGWADLLSNDDIDAVAEQLRGFGPLSGWGDANSRLSPAGGLLAGASAERGASLYLELGCPSCHGIAGRGDGSSAKELKDVWHQSDPPRDLTAPWTFLSGHSPAALYTTISLGLSGTPMAGYTDVATPQQIADVVAFIDSIARRRPWDGGDFAGRGQTTDPLRRGEYLVHAGMCGLCHTPVDPNGIYLADTHYLAGGMKVEAGAHGIFFSRNLTPDVETGLGNWSIDQIAIAIRTGHTRDRRLSFWGMPWMVLGQLTTDDARAIAAYLKTLPAVRNQVPDALQFGLLETALRKLTYGWPALMPTRLAYYAGNYGYEPPTFWRRDRWQQLLVWTQMIVVVLGICAFLLAPGDGVALAAALFVAVVVAVLAVIARYPALNFVPAESVVASFAQAIPEVKGDAQTPPSELLRRGRYLYGISSCPYCHNGNGAGGGKVNWSVFGTTWAANLTAHPAGLNEWSDDAILRAMTTGVARDGRALHWQAMIWDHLSNYDLEDQHALLAYVRTLPPVETKRPKPADPRHDDCAGDTFWVGSSNDQPGCGG
ncbi:MAG: c-type cytochrome [Deltaproteobacteria bacterium]|nr:c-type cytochrome [Deltaproteobacteria bacterium]